MMTIIQNRCRKRQIETNGFGYRLNNYKDFMGVTKHLLEECKTRKISLIELEAMSGISFRTMLYWVKGRDPKISSYIFFAESLGYELLLTKKQNPTNEKANIGIKNQTRD